MAKFIYRMQNILAIKLKLEEQAKSVYSMAQVKLTEEEEKLEQLIQKKENYQRELVHKMTSKLNVKDIIHGEDAVEITKYAIQLQEISVKNAKMQVEAARIKLNEAMVERKIQEKLKENAFEEFKIEVNAEEKKEIDELVSYKYSKPKDVVNK